MQDINTYLIYAYHEAISLGHCYVGSQHFLLSLLHHHRLFADVMKQYQMDYQMIRDELKKLFLPQKSCYPMMLTLQLERLQQYQNLNESITLFLQERCSVAAELLLRHGMKGEEIARTYQNLLIG